MNGIVLFTIAFSCKMLNYTVLAVQQRYISLRFILPVLTALGYFVGTLCAVYLSLEVSKTHRKGRLCSTPGPRVSLPAG